MKKKFILNADDFGMSNFYNRAVLEGANNGILTSASLCANGEDFEEAVNDIIPQCPDLSVGIHLNIIEGKPLTNCPLLTDSEGDFNKGYISLILNSFNKDFMTQTKQTLSYPYQKIMPEINKVWDCQTNHADFKYVYGHIDYAFQFHVYNEHHPQVILETFGHENPWINPDDIIKSGVLVVGKSKKNLMRNAKTITKHFSRGCKINPVRYEFLVQNRFGAQAKYAFYYAIIPPQTND